MAFDLLRSGVDELLERSLPAETQAGIMQIVQADPAEYDPYNLCTRRIGNAVAVEVRIRGAGAAAMTVERSHRLTIDIGCRLRERFGEGALVAVHVEPLMQRPAPFARRPPLTGFRSSFFRFGVLRKYVSGGGIFAAALSSARMFGAHAP